MADGYVDPTVTRSRYGGDSALTFEYLVHDQVWRCIKLQSSDWHGGKVSSRPVVGAGGKFFSELESYQESSAEAYVHAVEALYDLVFARIDNSVSVVYQEYEVKRERLKESVADDEKYFHDCAQAIRSVFRSIMVWLKKENYLQGFSGEDTTEVQGSVDLE